MPRGLPIRVQGDERMSCACRIPLSLPFSRSIYRNTPVPWSLISVSLQGATKKLVKFSVAPKHHHPPHSKSDKKSAKQCVLFLANLYTFPSGRKRRPAFEWPAGSWLRALGRVILYQFRAPSFRLFSGERVGSHKSQRAIQAVSDKTRVPPVSILRPGTAHLQSAPLQQIRTSSRSAQFLADHGTSRDARTTKWHDFAVKAVQNALKPNLLTTLRSPL